MSLPTPKFEVPGSAYIKQSAMRGQVTSLFLVSMHYNQSEWIYSISISKPRQVNALNYGERRAFTMQTVNVFAESELLTYCEALEYAIDFHQTQLARLQRFQADGCPDDTAGTD